MRSASDNLKFLEDLAKMATGALGSVSEIRNQIKKMVRETMTNEMDLVTREDYDRVEEIAEKSLERQHALEKRVAALEKLLKTKNTAIKKGKK